MNVNQSFIIPNSQRNNSLTYNEESFVLNESDDSITQNNSFLEDFNYIFDICQEIENNNCSETKDYLYQ